MTFFSANSTINLFKKTTLLLLISLFTPIALAQESNFLVLNYHDIIDKPTDGSTSNAMDLTLKHFEEQLQWLKNNNYKVISVQQVFDAAAGKAALPNKAVMLTFDDG